jgi:hypothetical protein
MFLRATGLIGFANTAIEIKPIKLGDYVSVRFREEQMEVKAVVVFERAGEFKLE